MKSKKSCLNYILILFLTSLVAQAQVSSVKHNKRNKIQATIPGVVGNATLNNETNQIDLSGEITNEGGSIITERGFVYSTSVENPTTADTKVVVENEAHDYSFKLENLAANTIYYVKSYAVNATGTSYGSVNAVDTSSLSDIKVDLKARIKTYPNPSTNYISLSGLAESKNYVIYTMQGKEVARGTISNNNKIDVRFLTDGLYLLKLENLEMVKFIKE